VFSNGQGEWNLRNATDGLSWYTSSHRTDFTMRTGIFEGFPHCVRDVPAETQKPGQVYAAGIYITESYAAFYLDNVMQFHCDLEEGDVASSGRFGFTSYSGEGTSSVQSFDIYNELPGYVDDFTFIYGN